VLVKLLLRLSLVVFCVAYKKPHTISTPSHDNLRNSKRTSKLLRTISGNSTSNRIHLSINSIDCTLRISLGLGSVILRLTGCVLLLSRLCPGGSAGEVADGFDDGAFE